MKGKPFFLKPQKAGRSVGWRLPWLPKKIAELMGWDGSEVLEMVTVKEGVLIRKKKL